MRVRQVYCTPLRSRPIRTALATHNTPHCRETGSENHHHPRARETRTLTVTGSRCAAAGIRRRELIPHVSADTKLSIIKTLRLTAGYIAHLTVILHEPNVTRCGIIMLSQEGHPA